MPQYISAKSVKFTVTNDEKMSHDSDVVVLMHAVHKLTTGGLIHIMHYEHSNMSTPLLLPYQLSTER